MPIAAVRFFRVLTPGRGTWRVLLVAAVTAFFAWLFLRQVDLGQALAEAGRLPVWAVGAALAALLANLAFAALRWRCLLGAAGFAPSRTASQSGPHRRSRIDVRRRKSRISSGWPSSTSAPR
jgi:uncharacterized membrane protein YbhN (UPF0104 family)